MEVFDKRPTAWPKPLAEVYGDAWSDPDAWARRMKQLGADLVNLRLVATHPDEDDRSREDAVETVKAVLEAVDLPSIVWGRAWRTLSLILLHHWIEHNTAHTREFEQGAEKANELGEHAVRDEILLAAEKLSEANDYLRIASEKLGDGPD
jgi:hypothetical protein